MRHQGALQRTGQLQPVHLAASAIFGRGERADVAGGHQRRRVVGVVGEVVVEHGLVVDVIEQVLVERRHRHITRLAEIFFPRQVGAYRHVRPQLRVAAAAGPQHLSGGRAAGDLRHSGRGGHLLVVDATARHCLGQAEAQVLAIAELGYQVQAGQHVVVGGAGGNPADQGVAIGLQGVGRLLRVHELHPHVAAQRESGHGGFDVELGIRQRHLFLDRVVAAPVALPVLLGQVKLAVERAEHVVVDDAGDAAVAQRSRVVEQCRIDRRAEMILVGGLGGAVAIEPGEVDVGMLGLGAVRIGNAQIHAAEDPAQRMAHLQAQGVDPVALAVELLATVVAVIVGIGKHHVGRAAQVDRRRKIRIAVARRRIEADAGECAVGKAAEQVGVVQLHGGAGGRQIRHGGPVAEVELVVPADRVELVVFLGVVVLQDRRDAVHRAGGDDGQRGARRGGHVVVGHVVVRAARPLRAVGELLLVEGGVVQVELGVVVLVGRPLEHGHQAVALLVLRLCAQLHALLRNHVVGHARRMRSAPVLVDAGRPVVDAPPPGLVLLLLDRLVELSEAYGDTQRVVEELVDIRKARAMTAHAGTGAGVEIAVAVALAAQVEHQHALGQIQRVDGVQVHRTGQALTDQGGIRRLVHGGAVDQLGRVLVVLHAAVLANGRLLAPVQRGAGKIGRQAADRDGAGLAVHALRGQAGQPRQAVGDAHIRQLADVFGGDRLDDLVGVLLDLDRALNAAGNARDHDGAELRCRHDRLFG